MPGMDNFLKKVLKWFFTDLSNVGPFTLIFERL